ncbi:MAG: DNA-directed RNA polymerase subunit beta, partial [Patescibacteria group bacterium]
MPKSTKKPTKDNFKKSLSSVRQNWGKEYTNLPKLDLLDVQKSSYKWFLEEGIGEILKEISPVNDFTGKNWNLTLKNYRIGKPGDTSEVAISKGVTYDAPLYVKASLLNKKTQGEIDQEVFLGDIPQMTERGTFVINGVERSVVSQLVRSPGVFFTAVQDNVTGKKLFIAEIRPVHGSWLEFATTRHETITVKIDRRRKFLATTFLKAIGFSSRDQISEKFKAMENEGKT